ncbi:MAG: hypothetical protein QOF33_2504 [Thermomicrobiales bacterium]|jgi:hypothetical protein|nr:hypothetical protein [Thermomicrobiales bacterium]MEA2530236.1 hypothetical protein [Thermomicrobiales bacterium]MEA2584419.1 hypothetical protein [Thermomicrobiales bacterium]MEA2597073.1 hypothetical protein [Thermomicrobiales bacterium]
MVDYALAGAGRTRFGVREVPHLADHNSETNDERS